MRHNWRNPSPAISVKLGRPTLDELTVAQVAKKFSDLDGTET
jgi:hypothetical protein